MNEQQVTLGAFDEELAVESDFHRKRKFARAKEVEQLRLENDALKRKLEQYEMKGETDGAAK